MRFDQLLPIGSVVLLKGGEKRLMIYGVGQTRVEDNTDYDYIGVFYPEGNMGEGSQFLFNHVDIEQVFFKGYEDQERTEFISRLQAYADANGK
jgi:hypothetical protein